MRAAAPAPVPIRLSPGPHWLDARALCHQLAERLDARLRRRRVPLDVTVGPGEAPVIGFAPALLDALELLATNAVEDMPEGGTLLLRATRDQHVVIEIGQRTDRHRRGRDVLTEARAATRLAEAARTIEAHRGRVTLRGQAGSAPRIVVELPAAGPNPRRA